MVTRMPILLGLAVLLGVSSVEGQVGNKSSKAEIPADRWRAWATTVGAETKLTVEGIYQAGGPGVVAVVKPATPQGMYSKTLILHVNVGTLPGMWPAVLHSIPAQYTQSPYKAGTYDSIHIYYPDGTSEMIYKIVDAGEGPKAQ